MIDFRYHVVSLISVFLALAVGIALGAGPLKETIGDTLTGQVEQLRRRRTRCAPTSTPTGSLKDSETYIDAAGPQLLAGTLTDRRVAVIELGTSRTKTRTGLDQRLDQSGATITGHVTLTDMWTIPTPAVPAGARRRSHAVPRPGPAGGRRRRGGARLGAGAAW